MLLVDDGHRRRLKLLEKEMIRAVEALDALQETAYQLYQSKNALHPMNDRVPSAAEVELEGQSKRTTEELLEYIRNPSVCKESSLSIPRLATPTTSEVGDEDLIDMSLRG